MFSVLFRFLFQSGFSVFNLFFINLFDWPWFIILTFVALSSQFFGWLSINWLRCFLVFSHPVSDLSQSSSLSDLHWSIIWQIALSFKWTSRSLEAARGPSVVRFLVFGHLQQLEQQQSSLTSEIPLALSGIQTSFTFVLTSKITQVLLHYLRTYQSIWPGKQKPSKKSLIFSDSVLYPTLIKPLWSTLFKPFFQWLVKFDNWTRSRRTYLQFYLWQTGTIQALLNFAWQVFQSPRPPLSFVLHTPALIFRSQLLSYLSNRFYREGYNTQKKRK